MIGFTICQYIKQVLTLPMIYKTISLLPLSSPLCIKVGPGEVDDDLEDEVGNELTK